MGLFSSLFGKKRTRSEQVVVDLINGGKYAHFAMGISHDKKGSEFESALITSGYFLRYAHHAFPNQYKIIQAITFEYLFELAEKYSIKGKVPMHVSEFINFRFSQYADELDPILNKEKKYVPSRALFNLYSNPLQVHEGHNENPIMAVAFVKGLFQMDEMNRAAADLISVSIILDGYRI